MCNQTDGNGISRFEFAQEIFKVTKKEIVLLPCSSAEFPTKVARPTSSKLINNSEIQLSDWRD
ncbi:sugar nucleotide-binding protein [Patescibacteria group bacterium]|nr:sugar nucleotide-binding protein [Patescibacteria group bacterium]MBU1757984.1 sugar nucleotide-binding protein [Patescibacteria group bacterium]